MDLSSNAFETTAEVEGVTLRIIRHQSFELMRNDVKEIYLNKYEGFDDVRKNVDKIKALTVAEYIQGKATVNVFLPVMDIKELDDAIPHEATHAALAIARYGCVHKMDYNIPVHISENTYDNNAVSEERLATLIGNLSAEIKARLVVIDMHIKLGQNKE